MEYFLNSRETERDSLTFNTILKDGEETKDWRHANETKPS